MPSESLSILLAGVDDVRRGTLESGLREAGYDQLKMAQDISGIAKLIDAEKPGAIVIDLGDPDQELLESLFQLVEVVQKPFVIYVNSTNEATKEAAIDAGVSAYIVDGLTKEQAAPVLEMAVRRFNSYLRMVNELGDAKAVLEERKVIDRAKDLLMQSQGLSEEEAFSLMRKTAMNQNRKLREVAESLVVAGGLLKK